MICRNRNLLVMGEKNAEIIIKGPHSKHQHEMPYSINIGILLCPLPYVIQS